MPEVDRAAIRVVTDNYRFAFCPSGKIDGAAQRGLSPPDPQGLVDLDVDRTIPMHCTGEPFSKVFKAEMPKKAMRS